MAQLPEVTDPGFLEGLESWPLAQVRSHRDTATEIETALSYLRRIVQGRLDIVLAELHHREHGERGDAHSLVDELPAILSGNVHAPGLGRLPTMLAPGDMDSTLEDRLEEVLPAGRLATIADMSVDDLRSTVESLTEFERTVSVERRGVLDVLDRLQEEIVRRYSTGEATVDSLLS